MLKISNNTCLKEVDRSKSKYKNTQEVGDMKRHAEHAENWPPVCCHTTPVEASPDTKVGSTVLVIFIGPVICENPGVHLFLTDKDERE